MDVEQHHFAQKDAVSSLHERLTKKEKIVCLDTSQSLNRSNDRIRKTWSPCSKRVSKERRKSTKPRRVDRSTSRMRTTKTSKRPSS